LDILDEIIKGGIGASKLRGYFERASYLAIVLK
jgi:hypothetical protein